MWITKRPEINSEASGEHDGPSAGLATLGVHQKERLFRFFKISLDAYRVSIVANHRTVADEVATISLLMPVTKDIKVSPFAFVPLVDGFVDGNVDSANASYIPDGMAMMKTDYRPVSIKVGVVAFRDDPFDSGCISEMVSKKVVHYVFQRMSRFRRESSCIRSPSMVARMTDNNQIML